MQTLDRIAELSILYEISGLPTRLKDFDAIAHLATEKAARLLGGDAAICYLYQSHKEVLHPQGARGMRIQRLADLPLVDLDAAIAQAIAEKRPLAWAVDAGDVLPNLLGPRYPVKAAIVAPLYSEDTLLGFLYVARLTARPFTSQEQTLYGVLADRVSGALENAHAFKTLERRVVELQTLNRVGQVLAQALDVEALLVNLHAQVNAVMDAESFFITLLDEASEAWVTVFELERGERRPAERHARYVGLTGHIMQTGAPLLFTTQASLEAFFRAQGTVLIGEMAKSWLGVPIKTGDKTVGVMAAQSYAHEYQYDANDSALLATIASQAAVALNNVRLLEQMRRTLDESRRRAMQLRAATEVAEAISSILDLNALLPRVVNVIQAHFDLYYAGLFLVDEAGQWAVLRAGTGQAGQVMLAAGHRLEVGGDSMIGAAIAGRRARIALDVGEAAIRFSNPYLPDTRSEMALPLISRAGVIGAMTIQSARENAFSTEDTAVLQTVANQVAVAIDNARLFAEAQAALEEAATTQRRYFGQAWREHLRESPLTGYRQTREGAAPLAGTLLPEVQQVITRGGRSIVEADVGGAAELVVPIKLREQPIGAMGVKGKTTRAWTEDDVTLVETVAEQFALAAENLRLLDVTQRRAAREQIASAVTARMRESLEVENVLQTAVREIGEALHLAEVEVRISAELERELLNESADL